jgi:hypothetical protein
MGFVLRGAQVSSNVMMIGVVHLDMIIFVIDDSPS